LGFLCLIDILTPLRLFFRYLEMTYAPIFKCSEANDVKKFLYTITIWKIWGVWLFSPWLTFPGQSQNLNVWIVQFIMLIGDTKNPRMCIANAIVEMKITHQVFRVTMESTLIFFPEIIGLWYSFVKNM
jgi:hypothetical protein